MGGSPAARQEAAPAVHESDEARAGAAAKLESGPARDLLGRPALPQDQPPDEGAPPLVVEEPRPVARVPLRLVAPLRGGGAAESARDRRAASADRTRDLPDGFPLAHEAHDVLALPKAKIVVTAHGRLPISICRRKQHRIRAPWVGLFPWVLH